MSRATQIADRKRIEAFFREMFRAERGIAADTAGTLAQRCARRIKRVVVWDDEQPPAVADTAAAPVEASAAVPQQPATSTPALVPDVAVAQAPPRAPAPEAATAPAPATAPEPASAPAFDPYAFSVVVVLTKSGKDGLMTRLAAIERPEHLKKLADAQHLAVDAALSTTAELRSAIVKAAELRIANRRAAAS